MPRRRPGQGAAGYPERRLRPPKPRHSLRAYALFAACGRPSPQAVVETLAASFITPETRATQKMPKRTDIDSILIIGAGPIVIGQASEFDYSGTQACKALKAEGYRIVLINSNPATIMTDPDLADATYIEPITPEIVAKIIERERAAHPGERMALLPTMGGQTALNTSLAALPRRHARKVRRRDDRRQGACHRQGRGSPAVPRGDDQDRACDAALEARP